MNIQLMGKAETIAAKEAQDYDNSPPKCSSCVYFRRAPLIAFASKVKLTRRGKEKTVKVPVRAHPISNPTVDRCTFGNFIVKPTGVCNEWHSSEGEKIIEPVLLRLVT